VCEPRREPFVDLDRDHPSRARRKRTGQATEPCADLEHEVIVADTGLCDELGGDRVATKEMLSASVTAARAPSRVPRAHGVSP